MWASKLRIRCISEIKPLKCSQNIIIAMSISILNEIKRWMFNNFDVIFHLILPIRTSCYYVMMKWNSYNALTVFCRSTEKLPDNILSTAFFYWNWFSKKFAVQITPYSDTPSVGFHYLLSIIFCNHCVLTRHIFLIVQQTTSRVKSPFNLLKLFRDYMKFPMEASAPLHTLFIR